MARTRTAKKKPDDALIKELIETVMASDIKELVYSTSAPVTTAILQRDQQYRQRAVPPRTEIMLANVRMGARGLIFDFELVEYHEEWQRLEFAEDKIFDALPNFQQALINALGDYESEEWEQAKLNFFGGHEARKAAAEKAQRKADANSYENDPMWGAF